MFADQRTACMDIFHPDTTNTSCGMFKYVNSKMDPIFHVLHSCREYQRGKYYHNSWKWNPLGAFTTLHVCEEKTLVRHLCCLRSWNAVSLFTSEKYNQLDMSMACLCLKSPCLLSGTCTGGEHHGHTKVNIMVMNGRLISFSFHVNQLSHSWDKAISNSELETCVGWGLGWVGDLIVDIDMDCIFAPKQSP